MEAKIHYLEMIQGIIDRMGSNSFMLKGWAITLAVGVFALSDKDSDKLFFLLFAVDLAMNFGQIRSIILKIKRIHILQSCINLKWDLRMT